MHSKFYKPKFWKFFPSKIKSANADNYIDICKCTPKLRNSSKVMEKRKYRVQMQLIKFTALEMTKMAVLALLDSPKLISRKIFFN